MAHSEFPKSKSLHAEMIRILNEWRANALSEGLDDLTIANRMKIMEIGFPLIVAFWQVYEFRVKEWVGRPLLAQLLIAEQRRILSCLVTLSLNSALTVEGNNISKFNAFMALRSKRFQSTLFLLCDSISFDPSILSHDRLSFLFTLGNVLEWEQARAHDISPSRLTKRLQLLLQDKNKVK